MKRIFTISFFLFFAIYGNAITSKPDSSSFENKSFKANLENLFKLSYAKKALTGHKTLPQTAMFSDNDFKQSLDKIPAIISLNYNDKVRKFIDFYTKENRAAVEIMLGLSQEYLPVFEKILVEHKLPPELKYLPAVESSFYPFATSEDGANGMWQLKYSIARIYGLSISTYIDERRSPKKSTYAAAEYLKQMYDVYNDWLLVIAAYNCGPGNVNKAIHRAGEKRDFWAIYDYLPAISREYVPAYIAMVYLMNNYQKHNLKPVKISLPNQFQEVRVKQKVHFGQVSEVLNIPIDILREINEVYKIDVVPAFDKKSNILRIPTNAAQLFAARADSIYNYKDSVYFKPKRKIVKPPKVSKKNSYANYSGGGEVKYTGKYALYKIRPGDNLWIISQRYPGVSDKDIMRANNLNSYSVRRLKIGQTIKIPVKKK